jgi:hypothetical protein
MNRLMRRIVGVGASAAVAGGVVLAAGGSASAATPAENARPLSSAAVYRYDPWVAGQLATFGLDHGHDGWLKVKSDPR